MSELQLTNDVSIALKMNKVSENTVFCVYNFKCFHEGDSRAYCQKHDTKSRSVKYT